MGAKKDVKMFRGGLMLSQDDFYVLKGRTYLAECCKMHVYSSLKKNE